MTRTLPAYTTVQLSDAQCAALRAVVAFVASTAPAPLPEQTRELAVSALGVINEAQHRQGHA